MTINRACGSSQQALDFAAQAVMSGQYDMVVAGGVETMSRVPLGAGAILASRLLARMRREGLRYGLQTMCEGGGTANATVIELLP